MAWIRLDDHFDEHDKTLSAGRDAMWVLIRGLGWCNRRETDGHLPAVALERIGSDFGPQKRRQLMRRLADVGFLHLPGHDCERCPQPADGWQVHDYADYQQTRADLEAKREQRRDAGRRGGIARAKRVASESLSKPPSKPEAKSKPGPGPVPQPENQRSNPSSTDVDRDDSFEHFWDAWPRRNGKRLHRDKAERAWSRLTLPERRAAYVGAKHYAKASDEGMAGAKDAFRWLQGREWPDWQTPAVPNRNGQPSGMTRLANDQEIPL